MIRIARRALVLLAVPALVCLPAHPSPVAAAAGAAPVPHSASLESKLIDLDRRYTFWSLERNPTSATDAGIHSYDGKLADFSPEAQRDDMAKLRAFRDELAALVPAAGAAAHERADYLLVRADLEGDWWNRAVLRPLQRNPTVYEGECTNGIFSIVKRPYAPDAVRLRDAIARLRDCPRVLRQGEANLTDTVAEFAEIAVEDIRDGKGFFTDALGELQKRAPATQRADASAALHDALGALQAYADFLIAGKSRFHGTFAVGKQEYEWYLHRALLLPFDSGEIAATGATELARDRALEAWEANRDARAPAGTAQPHFKNKAAFLHYYERSLQKLVAFVRTRGIVDIPRYVGPFHITQVPAALASTYPGGFMNPPAMFSSDPQGFYFVPNFAAGSGGFFVEAARQSVLPVLGHEGIPGHFLQFSYAYHNPDFIRHAHGDGVFAEGWAFYSEEMLMRAGLYDDSPAARKQVIHLMRHRATRVGVDVALATGTMTLPQAIAYFEQNAGIDEGTARGEGTRFAMDPGQAIDYLIGKTQIETLIGLVHDRDGAKFSLRAFHDRLLSYGTVPFSIVRYEWLGDDGWLTPAIVQPLAPREFS